MMTYEELYKLKIQPEGEDKVKALEAALRSEEAALKALIASFGTATQAQIQADSEVKKLTRSIGDLEKMSVRAKVALDQVGKGGGKGMSASGLMQVGYFLDDLQYGMRGVANNIPGVLQALGAGAGLAGTLSIVSAAAVLLYGQWDNLMGIFGMGRTKTQAEEMEELGKKTERTAAETAKLLKYQENLNNQQAQRGKSKDEKALADEVNSAVTELGDENAVRGLAQLRRDRYVNGDQETAKLEARRKRMQKEADTLRLMGYGNTEGAGVRQKEIDGLNAQIEDRVDKSARADLAAAASDPGKAKALRELVLKNPGAFGPGGARFGENLKKRETADADAAWERDAKKQDKEDKDAEKFNNDRIDADFAQAEKDLDDNQKRMDKSKAKRRKAANESGFGGMITELMADTIKQGGDVGKLKDQLSGGLAKKFGYDAGPEMLAESEKDAKRKVLQDFIAGDKDQRSSKVAGGGSDWARSIQGGVTNSRKDELAKLERIAKVLDQQLELSKKQAQAPPPPPAVVRVTR